MSLPPPSSESFVKTILFSSESVTEGHPDKLCDQVSDAVLDACLAVDPMSKVACESCCKTGMVLVFGERLLKKLDLMIVVKDLITRHVMFWLLLNNNHQIFHNVL